MAAGGCVVAWNGTEGTVEVFGGNVLRTLGYTDAGKRKLYPEEVLYLLYTDTCEVLDGTTRGRSFSYGDGVKSLLSPRTDLTAQRWFVYLSIKERNYPVFRTEHRVNSQYAASICCKDFVVYGKSSVFKLSGPPKPIYQVSIEPKRGILKTVPDTEIPMLFCVCEGRDVVFLSITESVLETP
ncbi:MAG: uncharacterized protein A8A55_2493 [Amphiamblys sp. WSBS2006]|nr:MAG: uncharacterized protein A8A55_2493 [Amphiamblys sp. WSBS2006]